MVFTAKLATTGPPTHYNPQARETLLATDPELYELVKKVMLTHRAAGNVFVGVHDSRGKLPMDCVRSAANLTAYAVLRT